VLSNLRDRILNPATKEEEGIALRQRVQRKLDRAKRFLGLDLCVRLEGGKRATMVNTPTVALFNMVCMHAA
jgi:hypothetical protein